MLLLLTGASGVGKSSVRTRIAPALAPDVVAVELADIVPIPPAPDLAWRQRSTEAVVVRALEEQGRGRHLLLAGDPVAPGDVLAAPSADRLAGFDACLLDCAPDEQRARLTRRGDPPELLPAHLAFAEWMRSHARDQRHRLEVLTTGGWDEMRWDRLGERSFASVDTTGLTIDAVAERVLEWARAALVAE